MTGRTKAEALAKLREAQSDVDRNLPAQDLRQTVGAYLEWWLVTVLPGSVRDSTVVSYATIVHTYVIPHVGGVRMAKLTPQHVETMLSALRAKGLSPRTCAYARSVLGRALSHAERHDLVRRNAATLAQGPSAAGTHLDDALSDDDETAVLRTLAGDRLYALAVLILALGLRKGEALALSWADIDLDRRTLTVRGTLVRGRAGLQINPPKTSSGERTLPLPEGCVTALREHRRAQAAERLSASYWHDQDAVFTTPAGTRLDPRNALRWWQTATVRAGIGRRRMHATRHTAATRMLADGAPLEVVSAILGHASLAITADVYVRVSQDAKRRALEGTTTQLRHASREESRP